MKVGTDGALIGAWTNVNGTNNILDVGTGTGLIALMLAQRTSANVFGLEIEKNAANEAMLNVENSPWKNRICIKNISFQDFVKSTDQKFDLIVSNPPFFTNSFKNEVENRSIARHNDLLPFSELIAGAKKLMNENGRLAVVLPNVPAQEFVELANHNNLFVDRTTTVKPKATKSANRFLIEFSKREVVPEENELIIYTNDSADFTEKYKELTRDFYLKF